VVVTGLGLVCPLGVGVEKAWRAAREGRSTARRIEDFETDDLLTKIACRVPDFDPQDWMSAREARRWDPTVQYAVAAARQAADEAGLTTEAGGSADLRSIDPDRCGVLIGSGIGGLHTLHAGFEALIERSAMRVSPITGAMMIPDMAAGQVAIELGLRGPNFCVVSACATGSHAIGEAAEIIRRGDADLMLAGASEAGVTRFGLAAFHRTGAMSTRNDEPERASRPFDVDRDGFVMGEGAGVCVLESLSHALARGATPIAELAGYGATADAYHQTAPREDGSGAAAAIRRAMTKAGVEPADIDYINAHGTGTQLNDAAEARAIRAVFGDAVAEVAVSSTKSMHGHCMGAAGGVEAVLTVLSLRDGILPPTINLDSLDPACDLDVVAHVARTPGRAPRMALSNSFGFGGHNAALLLARFDAADGRPEPAR
jgi:beta-ketoacyl-acyl-carrier-protein synthase II